jgi:hypothetical protein
LPEQRHNHSFARGSATIRYDEKKRERSCAQSIYGSDGASKMVGCTMRSEKMVISQPAPEFMIRSEANGHAGIY